ncbi:MAG: NYN domain-containing protein [Rhodobacteraceae bacterium]|nr:NYN domain-containing protein [Paracoccaceae bacterium]
MLRDRPLLAVLIDADNIAASVIGAILEEINKLGEPALRRVYGDWSSGGLKKWSDSARELGIVEHQTAANTRNKNATDIGMVIDAMDILHTGRFDGFVLVSSDSDFTALANRIRENGRTVYGIGEKKTPASLRKACNQFIYVENILAEQDTDAQKAASLEPITKVVPLILKAMRKIEQEGDWYTLSRIGSAIRADNPDFDPRSYGKTKLSDLVKTLNEFETKKNGTHLLVRRVVKD